VQSETEDVLLCPWVSIVKGTTSTTLVAAVLAAVAAAPVLVRWRLVLLLQRQQQESQELSAQFSPIVRGSSND